MPTLLPNRQTQVNRDFAYLALERFCHTGKQSSMTEFPNRIRELREARDMTIEMLAEKTGLSTSYVWRLESGERNLSVRNLNLFAHAFEIGAQEILNTSETDPAPSKTVKVMGRIGAGAEITPDMEQVPEDGLYEIETLFSVPPDAIAFEVVGDSMWPRYDPGDVVICWRHGTHISEVLGWEAAVKTSTGQRYLKRVLAGGKKNTFDLESHNAKPIKGVRIEWVSVVQSVVRSGQWRRLDQAGRERLVKKRTAA